MPDIKPKAGETDITPLNGYMRIEKLGVDGETMNGTVTDTRKTLCKFGDVVYFKRDKAMLLRVNGQEVCFVNETDVVFRMGA
jgi:co-chaperonin GroES (HSP10)